MVDRFPVLMGMLWDGRKKLQEVSEGKRGIADSGEYIRSPQRNQNGVRTQNRIMHVVWFNFDRLGFKVFI